MFLHRGGLHRVALLAGTILVPLLLACGESARTHTGDTSATVSVSTTAAADTDDFGAPLPTDARFAERIVSLNPAATEVIFAIGAESRLVGRSRWDMYPAQVSSVPALGDGIRPAIEPVIAAKPTLVILYATAENRAAAEALTRAGIRTMALRVDRIAQFHTLLRRLGVALGATERARVVSDSVQRTLDRVRAVTAAVRERPTVVWPVWNTPPMVIGAGSYMDELITIAGGSNVFHDMEQPSPQVSMEMVVSRSPQFVVVSRKQAADLAADARWQSLPAVRERHYVMHDPAVTGRPSVVLGMAAVQLARALHPTLADSLPR